jgi:hypothetical protein
VIHTPSLSLPNALDEVPADTHGICGPVSVKAAAKSREDAEAARRFLRQACKELRESYLARVQGRRPR